jgi:hypothetical protein
LLQKDWTSPKCKQIQGFELVGEGEIDTDANVLERREGGVEVEVEMRMGTGEGGMEEWRTGGMEENAEGERREEERHRPRMRMQARQEGCISESKRDELSRETRKSRQQWTEKDGVRNS